MKFLLNFETHPGLKILNLNLGYFKLTSQQKSYTTTHIRITKKMGLHWNTEKQGLQLI